MYSVATAATAKLFELQATRRVLFVFGRYIIAFFALGALQNYVISRHNFLPILKLLDDIGNRSRAYRAAAFANSEADAVVHGNWLGQFNANPRVVSGHAHFRAAQ